MTLKAALDEQNEAVKLERVEVLDMILKVIAGEKKTLTIKMALMDEDASEIRKRRDALREEAGCKGAASPTGEQGKSSRFLIHLVVPDPLP